MDTLTVPVWLRAKLGENASQGLTQMFSQYQQFATDRYERRLGEQVSNLRVELRDGLAGIRVEMANMRTNMVRWCVLCWVGQFAAIVAALSFMLGGR